MAKQQPTTFHRRSRDELVAEAFRQMIRDGEAVRTEVKVLLATGSTMAKVIYKVEPNNRK